MGGVLSLESRAGVGSDFSFSIPFLPAEGFVPEQELEVPVDLSDLRVLVVDDNDTNRRIFREFLEAVGARVGVASGAAEALSLLQAGAREEDAFHLGVLDVVMPGSDGFQLATDIRGDPLLQNMGLMILTSTSGPGDR